MNAPALPLHLTVQAYNALDDAIASLALARFLNGDEPFAASLKLTGVARAADLIPIDSVRWHLTLADSEKVVARGETWTAYIQRWRNGYVDVEMTATDPETLQKAVMEVRARAPVPEPRAERVEVEFWYGAGTCLKNVTRHIDVPSWDHIERNYTAAVRRPMAALVAMAAPVAGGRLLLWHGPPGTGKTTAIRALVRAWAGWCRALFVVDAERFLGEAGYLMSVLIGADDLADEDDDDAPRWRLIVIEDADELLRADAKRESGQALSRLLSMSDGFIGQGVNVLTLITTNEPVGRLHPAVVRPGRCLADVEFLPLSPAETTALLGANHSHPSGDLTLAEVYQRRGRASPVTGSGPPDLRTGQYL